MSAYATWAYSLVHGDNYWGRDGWCVVALITVTFIFAISPYGRRTLPGNRRALSVLMVAPLLGLIHVLVLPVAAQGHQTALLEEKYGITLSSLPSSAPSEYFIDGTWTRCFLDTASPLPGKFLCDDAESTFKELPSAGEQR
jgi:hypothetical protein